MQSRRVCRFYNTSDNCVHLGHFLYGCIIGHFWMTKVAITISPELLTEDGSIIEEEDENISYETQWTQETSADNPYNLYPEGKFRCDICNYSCNKRSYYDKHNLTTKHKKNTGILQTTTKIYTCSKCSKTYDKYNSYWHHERGCEHKPNDVLGVFQTIIYKIKRYNSNYF